MMFGRLASSRPKPVWSRLDERYRTCTPLTLVQEKGGKGKGGGGGKGKGKAGGGVKAGGKNDPVRPTVLRGLVRNSLEKTSQTSHPS